VLRVHQVSFIHAEQVYHERNCPTDWRYFDYKCYHVTSALTFQAARKYCRDHGADIVVYDYKVEIGLMQQMQPGVDSWVGLQIQDGEGKCDFRRLSAQLPSADTQYIAAADILDTSTCVVGWYFSYWLLSE